MDALFDNSPDPLTRLEAARKRVEETRAALDEAERVVQFFDAMAEVVRRRRLSKGERAAGGWQRVR